MSHCLATTNYQLLNDFPSNLQYHVGAMAAPSAAPPETPPPTRHAAPGVRNWAQMIIAGGVILFLCSQAELVLVVLLASVLIAFILAPVADFFERRKLPRSVAAGLAMFLLVAALVAMTYASYSEATAFARDLPKYSARIRAQIAVWQASAQQFDGSTSTATSPSGESARGLTSPNWVELASRGFGSIYQALVAASFIPFLVYFMLSWHRHVRSATVMLFRMEHRHTAYVTLGLIGKMMRTFLVGNLLVGVFLAIASIGIFAMLHLPFFYFVGPISGFFSLVPYLGLVLALLPPLMVGFSQMDSGAMMFLVVAVLGLHVIALNVLYPKFIGNRLQLNPLTVSMSLLFWGWLWGAMGLVLAIPLTAAIKIICDHIEVLRPYGAWMGE